MWGHKQAWAWTLIKPWIQNLPIYVQSSKGFLWLNQTLSISFNLICYTTYSFNKVFQIHWKKAKYLCSKYVIRKSINQNAIGFQVSHQASTNVISPMPVSCFKGNGFLYCSKLLLTFHILCIAEHSCSISIDWMI